MKWCTKNYPLALILYSMVDSRLSMTHRLHVRVINNDAKG